MFRLSVLLVLCLSLAGCATAPVPAVALEQQEQADLVVGFQSWNSVWLIKPDVTGMAGALPEHTKTFTSAGFVKLLRNLRTPRGFVVVVLDRGYSPDPVSAKGGMDAIQGFFEELGFRRVVLQDGAALSGGSGRVVLRDASTK
jgi:hypothetical protein